MLPVIEIDNSPASWDEEAFSRQDEFKNSEFYIWLESVGMEEWQICRMLFWENILLVLPNMLITLTVGTAAGYGIISFMKKSASYLEYQFPVAVMIFYSIGMLCIPLIIFFISIKTQNKNSLVERVRTGE